MKKNNLPPPSLPAPVWKRPRIRWAAGLFVGFLVLFGLSHDRTYYFDGLLQAGMIDSPLDVNPVETRYEWNHFLWYPTGRLFYRAAHAVGFSWEGYETLQTFNTLVGAAGAAVFFLILSRLAPLPWAAGWAVLACLGQVYWYRSAGAENHLTGGVWVLAQAWFLLEYWEKPGYRSLIGMGVTGLLAAYFHLGNFAAWGVAGLTVLFRRPAGKTGAHFTALVLLVLAGWLPYAIVHHWMEPGGFQRWWTWATALAHGYSPLAGKKGIDWNLLGKGLLTARTFLKSFLFFDRWDGGTILRVAAMVPALWVLACRGGVRPSRESLQDKRPFVFLIPFCCFLALYALWLPGNYMYWIVQWFSFCLFLGAISAARIAPASWAALGLMIVIVGQNNLSKVILPHKTNPDAFLVEMSRDIGRLTPPESPTVVSGRNEVNLKPYIPYFGKRNRLALDLFALNAVNQKTDAVDWLSRTIVQHLRAGIPVYVTEDALRASGDFADFNISSESLETIWRAFALLPVKDFPGARPNRLYLLWTPELQPELEDVILLRLKINGLREQLAAVALARLNTVPPSRRAAEKRRLENLTGLTLG